MKWESEGQVIQVTWKMELFCSYYVYKTSIVPNIFISCLLSWLVVLWVCNLGGVTVTCCLVPNFSEVGDTCQVTWVIRQVKWCHIICIDKWILKINIFTFPCRNIEFQLCCYFRSDIPLPVWWRNHNCILLVCTQYLCENYNEI